MVETLESRRLLSADPVLVIITHGFGSGVGLWQTEMAEEVQEILMNSGQNPTPDENIRVVGPNNGSFSIAPVEDGKTENVIIVVDWRSGSAGSLSGTVIPFNVDASPIRLQAQELATQIKHFLINSSAPRWDVLFIGHSRGGVFNNELARLLGEATTTNLQLKDKLHHVETIELDPTAARNYGDWNLTPELVPSIVNRARNYDDGHTLVVGVTKEGFTLKATEGAETKLVYIDIGVAIDENLGQASFLSYLTRDPIFGPIAVQNASMHSWNSHVVIPSWYMSSGRLYEDVRSFLKSKDVNNPVSANNGGEEHSPGNDPGKTPVGHGGNPDPTYQGPDDHVNSFGGAATVISIGQTKAGSIESVGDHDWFQFIPQTNGPILIEVIPLDGQVTPYARFHWDNKTLIAHNTGGGSGAGATIRYKNAEAGRTYFLDVSGAAGTTGSYYVRVTQPATVADDPADKTLPNQPVVDEFPDTLSNAHTIVLDSNGSAAVSGAIKSPLDNTDDVDWFQFVAKTTGLLTVDISTPNSSLDTHLRIHNSSLLLAQDHDHVEINAVAGQIYWLQVRSGSDAGSSDILSGFDRTGKYVVKITQPTSVAGGSGTDTAPGPLPGWGGVRGVQINLDSSGIGSSRGGIDEPGEVDWYQINGAKDGNMLVTVAGVNTDLTEFVTAFRSNGGGIDSDTGEFDSTASVGFTVAANETIIIAVSSLRGVSTGTYTINVTQPDNLPGDDKPNFGQTAYNMGPDLTDEGNGFIRGKIEQPTDDDWIQIPIRGTGYVTVQVDASQGDLVPLLELNRDGTSGGFFESDDGADGAAKVTFLPSAGMTSVWAKISSFNGTQGPYTLNVWHTQDPNDDFPDSGGQYAAPRKLVAGGSIMIQGSLGNPGDIDAFRVVPDVPGPIVIMVIPLTEGFAPSLKQSWSPADVNGDTTGTTGPWTGRGGRTFDLINGNLTYVNIDVKHSEGDGTTPMGDYVLYVWQPQHINDIDPNTVGIQASPILLDGTGNGSLEGNPNGSSPSPALDYAGDKDVFQVVAASDRPMTFTVNGPAIANGTFLRVYDASGHAVATDYNSGPGGVSQITLDASRGDLFYLEVTAYDGSSTGSYTVAVGQPIDDHPDALLFNPQLGQVPDATKILLDGSGFGQATGQIETNLAGDHDVFQVQSTGRGQMTVDVAETDDTLDSFVKVYDSHGNLVAIDDDSGDIRNSRVTFNTFQGETYFIEVSGYNGQSVGGYRVSVQESGPVGTQLIGSFDNFNSGFDTSKWSLSYTGQSNLNVSGGTVTLVANGNNSPTDGNSTTLASRAYVTDDVSFDLTGTFGGSYNYGYVDLTDGGSNRITIQMNRNWPSGDNVIVVGSAGYTELENNAPHDTTTITFTENQSYHFRILEESGEIRVYMGSTLLARFAGTIADRSFLNAKAVAAAAPDRIASLTLDNVAGEFLLTEAEPTLYDSFDDNQLDFSKFTIAGTVEEQENALKIPLFKAGNAVSGYVSTNGSTDGMNLRGFKLNANRTTEPKKLTGWDTTAQMQLTNGTDYIQIGWKLADNTFQISTGGAYGSHTVDISVPAGEVPDGPLEVRERNGNIEVLHNNSVKLTLFNQTIRAGSFFTFAAAGNPFGQSMNNPPQDFAVAIDGLTFYHDPAPNTATVIPTLAAASDTGVSSTDAVTNMTSLTFNWDPGPAGTQYQWREGTLADNGTATYGAWSSVQSEVSATVNLSHASTHVFSVRPLDSQGNVGQESTRGVEVDITPPSLNAFDVLRTEQPKLQFAANEPIVASLANIVVRDSSNQVVAPLSAEGSGTTTLSIVLPPFAKVGTYSVTLSGATDIAGNLLIDVTHQFSSVGEFDAGTGVLSLFAPGSSSLVVMASGSSVSVIASGVADPAFGGIDAGLVRSVVVQGDAGTNTIDLRGITKSVFSYSGGVSVQVSGGGGNDTIFGSEFDDTIAGDDGNDLVFGGVGNDVLIGGLGNDWLNGGGGANSLAGGVGDDVYAFSDTTTNQVDTVWESAAEGTDLMNFSAMSTPVTVNLTIDTVATMSHRIVKTGTSGQAANFENVNGGLGNDNITGNAVHNVIYGNGGNDTLNGGDGSDQLDGGAGNDLLIGGNGGDILSGGAGDNYLLGNAGNDILDGGDGYAAMVGGQGDDSYYFFAASFNQVFTVVELAGEGVDTLNFAALTTSVTANLTSDTALATMSSRIVQAGAAGQSANFENVTGGSANDQLTGNAANNLLRGGGGDDTLSGGAGNDILVGGAGNDTLKGISGRNILIGGAGADLLLGGTGEDLLLSGSSNFESNPAVLQALLAEWVSANPYQMRVDHLRGNTGGGANSTFTLNPSTVTNDANADYLTGNAGQDWFLANSLQDVLTDKAVDEVFTQIDTWI